MPKFGNIQPQLDLEEHAIIDGVPGKKVFVIDDSGNQITSFTPQLDAYEYMGKQTSGAYTYYGFRQYGSSNWRIMRKDGNDASAWAYAYGTSGWTASWASPAGESYGDPPSS